MKGPLKGVVLSGGKGNRLRPLTYTGAKQLVPIANKPILFYAIEELVEAGIRDITIVVSTETGDQVELATGDGDRFGAKIAYVRQEQPGGIAQAIGLAHEAVGDAPFVTFLGDNFVTDGIVDHVRAFSQSADDAAILLKQVPDVRELGVAEFDGERLARLIEKPQGPSSNLAVIGIYMFTSRVFEAIAAIEPSARGELEITDTLQWLIDQGCGVAADIIRGEWIDTGKHDDLLAANRLVLATLAHDPSGGSVDASSELHGCVVLEAGAVVVNSIITGPAIIGERTRIEDATIGPYTSIDHDCCVIGSEISGSVVLEGSRIEGRGFRIESSLIGRSVELHGGDREPRGYQVVLGDFSKMRVP